MDIFDFMPLYDVNTSINNSFAMIGAEHRSIIKYAPSATVLKFGLSFSFDLAGLREFESFFIEKKARQTSFFLRSMRVDFQNIRASGGVLLAISANRGYGMYARRQYIFNRRNAKVYEISNIIGDKSSDQIYLRSGADEFKDGDECENAYKVRFDSDTLRAVKQNPVRYKVDMSFKEVVDE